MKYRIAFKKSVSRDLKKIGRKQSRRILEKIEQDLSIKAAEYPELKGPFAGLRKCRIGDYRVIYTIVNDTVIFARMKHNKEAYE